MNKKIIIGIVFGLVVTLVFPSINTCATQMSIKSDPNMMEQSNFIPVLIGFWNFNEGSGDIANDYSGWGNDGTIYGATWTTGVSGNALEFDGDDYVDCGDDDGDLDDARTITAWIKQPTEGMIVYKMEQHPELEIWHGYALGVDSSHNVIFVSNNQVCTGGEVTMNEWVHVAAVLEGGWNDTLKLYINGELDSTFTDIQPIDNDAPLRIGGSDFEGSIDEVRIEMICLGESRILELYSNRLPNTPTINGQTSGEPGTEYEYTINAVDPDEYELGFYIDWGDGNFEYIDCYPSGTDVIVKHTWETKGEYTIKVKAIEAPRAFGFESDWGTLSVIMPVNYNSESSEQQSSQQSTTTITTTTTTTPTTMEENGQSSGQRSMSPLFLRLLERFSNLFPILRTLLGL